VIVAEKRLGELQLRTGTKFKKLLTFTGDTVDELVVEHPLNKSEVPILINNDVTADFGTGINIVSPAHDFESLKVAYHYNLPKNGFVDEKGLFTDDMGSELEGLSVLDEETNVLVCQKIKESNKLFTQYKYQNEYYEVEKTGEKIILRSNKSWFLDINEQLKMKCFEELSTTRFAPKLNMKDAQ
tara:strand:+ start:491 stop:1042 length:552 start_codon:yes stop_codon:yes gene_type:complete